MIVVADAGPLHYLILLDQSELLHELFGRVAMPVAVADEWAAANAPAAVRDWMAARPTWAEVPDVPAERVAEVSSDLDHGERCAIALATVLGADLLLIDDADGRAEARRRHLRMTGTLGVLRAAAERGSINVPHMLDKLRATNFYLDEGLIAAAVAAWINQKLD